MIQIIRKEGWILNPNDKVVNAILKRCEINSGECPCHNEGEDKHCPCSDYREHDVCHCGLYVKMDNIGISINLEDLPEGMTVDEFLKAQKVINNVQHFVVKES